MMNSPKTSTSFSQLESAFELIMSNKKNYKTSPTSSVIQESENNIKTNKSMNSPMGTSLSQQPVNSDELSIQNEETNELGLNSNIKPNELPVLQSSVNQLSDDQEIITTKKQKDQKRLLTQGDQKIKRTKENMGRSMEEEQTDNPQSHSLLESKNQKHTSSSNQLRKSVDNQAFLNSLDSMFRKKNNTNQETSGVNKEQREMEKRKEQYRKSKRDLMMRQELSRQESIDLQQLQERLRIRAVLNERLKNLKIFYGMRVEQIRERRRTNDRVFMELIQEREKIHRERMARLQRVISAQKRENVSLTKREKIITRIESATQLSINQRERAYEEYEGLQEELSRRRERIEEKIRIKEKLEREERELREEVENSEKIQLRLKKWNKEMQALVVKGQQKVENLKKVLERDYYDSYY